MIVSRESHAVWHETGGGGANAGIQFTEVGAGGRFTAGDFIAAVKPRDHMLYPPTTLEQYERDLRLDLQMHRLPVQRRTKQEDET